MHEYKEYYDVVDSNGNVVETAAEQQEQIEALSSVVTLPEEVKFEKPKELTEGEKKKLRKLYITVQHGRVIACGHVLDLSKQPSHRNCEHCWFAFFSNHREVVDQCIEMHAGDDGKLIEQLQGKKFLTRYRQFMSTLAQWEKETQENNG